MCHAYIKKHRFQSRQGKNILKINLSPIQDSLNNRASGLLNKLCGNNVGVESTYLSIK